MRISPLSPREVGLGSVLGRICLSKTADLSETTVMILPGACVREAWEAMLRGKAGTAQHKIHTSLSTTIGSRRPPAIADRVHGSLDSPRRMWWNKGSY